MIEFTQSVGSFTLTTIPSDSFLSSSGFRRSRKAKGARLGACTTGCTCGLVCIVWIRGNCPRPWNSSGNSSGISFGIFAGRLTCLQSSYLGVSHLWYRFSIFTNPLVLQESNPKIGVAFVYTMKNSRVCGFSLACTRSDTFMWSVQRYHYILSARLGSVSNDSYDSRRAYPMQ